MIRIADFQAKSLRHLRALSPDINKLKDAATEADKLDRALVTWSDCLPDTWRFSFQSITENPEPANPDDFPLEGSVYKYTSYAYATTWIQYLAIRLVVNGVHLRFLSALAQCAEQPTLKTETERCQKNVSSLASSLCYSVPVFFKSMKKYGGIVDSSTCAVREDVEIEPRMAAILSCPLVLAVTNDAIPKTQRLWLQRRLKSVANAIGVGALHCVADKRLL